METLKTYVNTKEISGLLINLEEITRLTSIFFRVTLSDTCVKNSPWQICPITFIKL